MTKELTALEAFELVAIGQCKGKRKQYIGIVNKALKAFEIIKEKRVDVFQLLITIKIDDLNEYNKRHAKYLQLTQEEYTLLKEILSDVK